MDSSKELKKQIVQTAVERVMEAHQVPARQLLATLQRMEKIISDYQALDTASKGERDAHASQLKGLNGVIDRLTSVIDGYEERAGIHSDTIGDLLASHDAKIAEVDSAISRTKSLKPEKGNPGKNAPAVDVTAIVAQVTDALRGTVAEESSEPEPAQELDMEALYQSFIERIQKERPIDVSHIKNAEAFLYNGKKYKIEELMRGAGGAGGSSGTSVYGEVVAGSGTAWTLANAPTSGTLRLFANGQRLTLTVDYSIVGAAITTVNSWAAGTLLADYNHA